jgi:hypothetical protein
LAAGTLNRVRLGIVLIALVAALAAVPLAQASFIVDRNTSGVTLRIAGGAAIVNYRTRGLTRNVTLSGAVNARPPSAASQVAFDVRYGYGAKRGGACLPYDGPALPFVVAACKAPDGSYWALQSWQRLMPNYGGTSAAAELSASHWTGELPKLEVWLDWKYAKWQHLFGRLTYAGKGVFGFKSTSGGNPLDSHGRNLYLDTLDSSYGSGWRRENSFLAHNPTGVFCYGFFPHRGSPGTGAQYRLSVQGPGVTPIVSWNASALDGYDSAQQAEMTSLVRSFGDRQCR